VGQPVVPSEDSRTADTRRAQISLDQWAASLDVLKVALHDATERYMQAKACLVNAQGGPATVPAGSDMYRSSQLGILMANDIIFGRPQDVRMELSMAQELWDNPKETDDPALLAGYLSTLREYVERGGH